MKIREFILDDLSLLEPNEFCPDSSTMRLIANIKGAEIFTIVDENIIAILCAIRRPNNIWTVSVLASKHFKPKHCKYLRNIVKKAISIYNPKLIYSISQNEQGRNRLQEFIGFKKKRKIKRDGKTFFVWVINGR